MDTLYRYRRTGDSLANTIEEIKGRLWCSAPKYLNDPFDGIGYAKSEKVIIPVDTTNDPMMVGQPNPYLLENILYSFVACFSKDWDNPPMWAHYSLFQGVCLGYDYDKLSECVRNKDIFDLPALGLKYNAELNFVDYKEEFTISANNPFVKSADWLYEKEWRIVVKGGDKDTPGLIINTRGCLTEIIIGHQTDQQTITTILDTVKFLGREVPIYKAEVKPGKAGYFRERIF